MKWTVILDPYDGPEHMAVVGVFDTYDEADELATFLFNRADVGVRVAPMYPQPNLSRIEP